MFSTLREQIYKLQQKGLKIDNNSKNRDLLLKCNYYNLINGFKKPFLDKSSSREKYLNGTSLEEIYNLFDFDRKLRTLLLNYLLIIENNLKSKISYEFSKKYGEFNYLTPQCYSLNNDKKIKANISFVEDLYEIINKQHESDIYYHFITKQKPIPFWAAMNFFDLGTVRKIYDNLESTISFNVANSYNLSTQELKSMLSTLNMFRNVCAHDNKIMGYKIKNKDFKVSDLKVHQYLNLKKAKNQYVVGKNDLFALFIVFKYLLSDDEFKKFYCVLNDLFNTLSKKITTININDIYSSYMLPLADSTTKQHCWKDLLNVKKF